MSDLKARLERLRRQSGTHAAGTHDAGPAARLRRELERRDARRHSSGNHRELAQRLGARVLAEGLLVISERLTRDARHGDYALCGRAFGRAWPFCTGPGRPPADAAVFMDTETTGLAGGTGTLVFLLGMARFSAGALELQQLLLTGFAGEVAMLAVAREFLRDAASLVTFNGRSFDAPLLAARYRLAGIPDPFAPLSHVDLLHATRRRFRNRWPDCRLRTVERRLLGVLRHDDLPGAEAPAAWFDWVRRGRDAGLAAVCAHNRLDLLSLAVLPAALGHSQDAPLAAGADLLACARQAAESAGAADGEQAAYDYLQRHRRHLDRRAALELARLARRRGQWSLALALWEELAAGDEPMAIEQLAKYHEHRRRDYSRAMALTARLLARAPEHPPYRQRDARLRARLAGTSGFGA